MELIITTIKFHRCFNLIRRKLYLWNAITFYEFILYYDSFRETLTFSSINKFKLKLDDNNFIKNYTTIIEYYNEGKNYFSV